MFTFFQRRPRLRQLLPGGIDAHCHLLPGVDDGAADMEESLSIIRGLQALGLRGAVCTPHIMASLPQNTPAYLRQAFEHFQSIVNRQSSIVNFQLHLAAEYMLDETFPRHLASGDLLTIPEEILFVNRKSEIVNHTKKFLLVELPQYLLPPGWQDMLDAILSAGYTPLLAAAAAGKADTVQYLLNHGAAVNHSNGLQETALMLAAQKGHAQVVQMLLAAGADVNAVTKDRETPLMVAVTCGHMEAVRFLLANGADPDIRDANGLTASQRALRQAKQGLKETLREVAK